MIMQFNKAERKKSRLRLALCGVSGSGKTMSALMVAKGLGGRTAVIDTENGSASLYSDRFDFDVLELEAPYSPERFIEAINAAENAGYDNVIIDSMSHEWVGSGGCLEINDFLGRTKFKTNSFMAWSETGSRHIKFLEKIVTSKIHIIATVRMKNEHVQDGKTKKVHKVGMKYEMREDFEYEFTSVFNIDRDGHFAISSKDRTGIFTDEPFVITPATGEQFDDWLNSGKNYYMSDDNLRELASMLSQLNDVNQDRVRKKYPNFANERDDDFARISHGLDMMLGQESDAAETAKAEQEASENRPASEDGQPATDSQRWRELN
jgi:hypothetical protein